MCSLFEVGKSWGCMVLVLGFRVLMLLFCVFLVVVIWFVRVESCWRFCLWLVLIGFWWIWFIVSWVVILRVLWGSLSDCWRFCIFFVMSWWFMKVCFLFVLRRRVVLCSCLMCRRCVGFLWFMRYLLCVVMSIMRFWIFCDWVFVCGIMLSIGWVFFIWVLVCWCIFMMVSDVGLMLCCGWSGWVWLEMVVCWCWCLRFLMLKCGVLKSLCFVLGFLMGLYLMVLLNVMDEICVRFMVERLNVMLLRVVWLLRMIGCVWWFLGWWLLNVLLLILVCFWRYEL